MSEPVRLAVRGHHTRSHCAESTAQWCCCCFCRPRIIFGLGKIATISRVISAMQIDDQRLREDARGMPTLGPSRVPPAPQLKREWSRGQNSARFQEIRATSQRDILSPICPATRSGLYQSGAISSRGARPRRSQEQTGSGFKVTVFAGIGH
jgi:hypothetical protein